MKRHLVILAAITCLNMGAVLIAQQPQSQQPSEPQRVDARKKVVVYWNLGDQAWNFDEILATYEPVKGYLEPRGNQAGNPPGNLAVWKLKMARDFEEGAVRLHEQMRGSPFKVVLLDEDRTVINPDVPAQITAPSGRMGDTIELLVALPDAPLLRDVRLIRVEKRTDVGF